MPLCSALIVFTLPVTNQLEQLLSALSNNSCHRLAQFGMFYFTVGQFEQTIAAAASAAAVTAAAVAAAVVAMATMTTGKVEN